jgi:plastocyanin
MHGGGEAALLAASTESPPAPLSERAVVYLEGEELNGGPYRLPARDPTLDQRNLQFHPRVLAVLVGTRVDFPNRDNLFHNVFSYSQPKEFDLGRYPKDDSRSVTFDRPGIVRVYCDIHSRMSATILVLRHPYFTSPDDAGDYAITGVPPGKYHIVLWYDRDVLERKFVEVKPGETAEVNFSD